jgi:hypothetical protein
LPPETTSLLEISVVDGVQPNGALGPMQVSRR